MYILLSGVPPFNGDDDSEILKQVELGKYDLNSEHFFNVSNEAKSLIKKLLEYDHTKRCSASEALEHVWIKERAPNCKLEKKSASKILNGLKTFRADKKLQEATIAFIVDQLISKEEVNELKKVFIELDKDNDGKLSFQEIVNGYKTIFGSANPEKETREIFDNVDSDNNGFLSYDGKILNVNNKNLLEQLWINRN